MRLHAAIAAGVAIVALFALALAKAPELGFSPLFIIAAALLLLAYSVLISPSRRYRALGYRLDAEELTLGRGVWTRIETIVPLARVQHIDIAQGPLERSFGVCRLLLHTAGTAHSLVVLPGLSRTTAEAMRDEIRARIRDTAA